VGTRCPRRRGRQTPRGAARSHAVPRPVRGAPEPGASSPRVAGGVRPRRRAAGRRGQPPDLPRAGLLAARQPGGERAGRAYGPRRDAHL